MQDAFVKPLLEWYQTAKRDLPWRHTKDPYSIWISEIMLQQTRVEAVKGYYTRFLAALPDVRALAGCPEDVLMKLWEGLGYYSRARNLKRAAGQIIADGGHFPETREELLKLKGIGPYTAGAIAAIAFGQPTPAVDGNVLRVYARMNAMKENVLAPGVRKRAEEELGRAMQGLTASENGDFVQAMIELGAIVCVPNGEPLCGRCPAADDCEALRLGIQAELPLRKKDTKRRIEKLTVLLVRDGSRTAIRRRAEKGLLAGLFEFPNVPGYLDREAAVRYIEEQGIEVLRIREAGEAKHLFSHVEWHMSGYEIRVAPLDEGISESGQWLFVENDEIEKRYAIPSAFSTYADYLALHTAPFAQNRKGKG